MIEVDLTVKTENSQRLLQEASKFSPKGVQGYGRWSEPFPLFFKKAMGARIWDVDDNEYIDYHASFGPAVLGYNEPRVRKAVTDTLENEGVFFAAPHPKEVELTKLFAELIPCAKKTVICGGGGSDPMYNAVRVARAYTGKKKLLKFEGGYHGWHDYVAASVRPDPAQAGPADAPHTVPGSLGSLEEAIQQIVVAPFNQEAAVERIVQREKDKLAAIIVEPVCHAAGCLIVRENFLRFLRDLCNQHGIVLIFDEVITGFRHHPGGVQAIYGITPDLGVFGKAMANGYPISALAGKSEIMSLFTPEGPVLLSGTFMGHLLGVTAALKTIEILQDGEVHKKLWRLGNRLCQEINKVIEKLDLNARCYNFGSIWCLYFTRKVENFRDIIKMTAYKKAYPVDQAFRRYLLNHGIYIQPGPTNRAFISAAHTDEDIDRTIEITSEFFTRFQNEFRQAAS
jgi:glutamate-1-semialdehyde 2,1-aminomutase